MSRVSSLGLHTPTALPFCITESLLPDPPPPESYTWVHGLPHEELLTTGNSVIWSQGGVIRRVFRYDIEKEPVVQALLTWFPSDDPYDAAAPESTAQEDEDNEGYSSSGPEGNKRKSDWESPEKKAKKRTATWNTKNRSYGNQMGEFPKSRGNVGAGLGRQRTQGAIEDEDEGETEAEDKRGRARALVVFLKTQAFIYFASGTSHVIHLPFEVERAMPAPRGLILQRKPPSPSAMGQLFGSQSTMSYGKDAHSLFSMSDPLLEIGMVVMNHNSPSADNIVFISPSSELDRPESQDQLNAKEYANTPEVIFAVTHDIEGEQIALWQVQYIPQAPPTNAQRPTPTPSGTLSRRQSTFMPGTGATTPITGGGPGSLSNPTPSTMSLRTRDSLGPHDLSSLNGLGEEFESSGRRSSRRVSSLVARADLPITHDSGRRFSDVSGSLGASFMGPPAPQNSQMTNSQPVDELLSELTMGAGIEDLGLYDGEGLRNEILMTRIDALEFRSRQKSAKLDNSPKVFTLNSPLSVTAAAVNGKEAPGPKIAVFVLNREEGTLHQLIVQIQIHSSFPNSSFRRPSRAGSAASLGYTPVLQQTLSRQNVLDAIKLEDSGIQKVLVLTDDGKFELYSPWGGTVDISLPSTLARWNPNVIGEDGSRRGSRKKGFARTLSTTPDLYTRLTSADTGGRVTVVDGDGVGHRISISLAPRESSVKTCLDTLRVIHGATAGAGIGEGVWTVWMNVAKWLEIRDNPDAAMFQANASTSNRNARAAVEEWKAFVITVFLMAVPMIPEGKPVQKRKSGFARSTSMVAEKEWEEFISSEGDWGSGPEYMRSPAWRWMPEEEDEAATRQAAQRPGPTRGRSVLNNDGKKTNRLMVECTALAREFLKHPMGEDVGALLCGREANAAEIRRAQGATSLLALHLLMQEWKLDIAMEGAVRRLCPVLRQLAGWLGWKGWVEKYMLEDIEMVGWEFDAKTIAIEVPVEPCPPWDIYQWLRDTLNGVPQKPFMLLQDIFLPPGLSSASSSQSNVSQRPRNPFSLPPPPMPPMAGQKPVFARLTTRTRIVTELYRIASNSEISDAAVVEKMVELKVTLASIQRLPEGIAVPLRETIARCQEQPPTTWGIKALELVGRKDLRMLIDPGRGRMQGNGKYQLPPTHEAYRDVHTICNIAAIPHDMHAYDAVTELDRRYVSKLLFKDDRRMNEAAKLLQSALASMAKCLPEPQWSEQETLDAYKEVAGNVAVRTLAVPAGRGMFHYSARIPLLTEKYPIAGFNLNCIIKPVGTTVMADKAQFSEDKVSWAFFHAGVAAGLSISREAKDIDTSWIVFNKPPELTNRHAGFLLGLGLNGHLKNIAKWHAFNYLTPKHNMSSIGLLLGLSASYLGTMDTTVTKILSVHVIRLLPPGSAELNLSAVTQTAGIMGIGLLYANTQHRRMSEVMLSEIEHVEEEEGCVPTDTLRDEGYRLAAGFALGFINLGAGKDLKGLQDMHLVERLLNLSVGSKKASSVHELDNATAGATIALALVYMKSNDGSLARKVDIPDTLLLLDYVRPDIFLLRTLARNLIMWDEVEGSFAWIKQRLRPFHRDRYKMESIRSLNSDDMPFYNVIAGLCFTIALKFAGSEDHGVRDLLLHYLDQFIRICGLPALNYDQRLTRTAVRNCQDLLALSAATVMAGTGDIPVFRRLRKLHGRVDFDTTYGSHLAAHMAIGVIFLGSGAYTFSTENTAIAGLICAFYPLFPNSPLDNTAHLQAFRHFWTLAVEARCLVPRDVDTFSPTPIPISIQMKDGRELHKTAPCLLPELRNISTVMTLSPLHWTVILDFERNPQHRENFESSQSIYVHPRSPHASQSTVFQATLQALDETEMEKAPFEWLGDLPAFAGLDKSARALMLKGEESAEVVDGRLELEAGLKSGRRDRLRGIEIVCAKGGGLWIGEEEVDELKAAVWVQGDGV